LGLRDELLDERLQDVIVPLEALLTRLEPEVVYVTHRGDVNQDHRAVFQATLVSCRSIARPKVRRLLSYETLSSTEQAPPFPEYAFQPNVFVNITESLDTKMEAMRQYQRELRDFPHPRSLSGIEVQARMRGMQAGYEAAEAFALIRDHWE
jgi:LmbE family N-acetylglucosaminyl deacetylase